MVFIWIMSTFLITEISAMTQEIYLPLRALDVRTTFLITEISALTLYPPPLSRITGPSRFVITCACHYHKELPSAPLPSLSAMQRTFPSLRLVYHPPKKRQSDHRNHDAHADCKTSLEEHTAPRTSLSEKVKTCCSLALCQNLTRHRYNPP